jgi:hypothetical protein
MGNYVTLKPPDTGKNVNAHSYLRQLADQVDPASRPVREGWAYPSPHHLLLDVGRLFTPAPLPPDMDRLSEGSCYANAAQIIAEHPGRSLVYVEGYGTCLIPGYLHTPHDWATSVAAPVAAPATAIDPTWPDNPRGAYLGIPFADPGMWPAPVYGAGILQELGTLLPILREGLPADRIADIGRSLPAAVAARTGPTPV